MIGRSLSLAIEGYFKVTELVDSLEAQLSEAKEIQRSFENVTIPNELQANGLSRLTTEDGYEIRLDKFIKPKILDRQAFYDWIDRQGYSAIIKTTFDLDKGCETGGVEEFLRQSGIDYIKEVGIHHKSLEKAVREIVLQAEEVNPDVDPVSLFPSSVEIDIFTKAVIKRSK